MIAGTVVGSGQALLFTRERHGQKELWGVSRRADAMLVSSEPAESPKPNKWPVGVDADNASGPSKPASCKREPRRVIALV